MTYAANDLSVSNGEPVEFYRFTGPFGVFRYTTSHDAETLNGEQYLPLPGLRRTAIETGSVIDTLTTNDISVPCDCELALLYNYGLTPRTLNVTVYRAHRGDDWATDYSIEWTGIGTGYSVTNDVATISTGSVLQALLNGNLSSVYYQRICNHTLFDARCKAVRADFTVTATVTHAIGQLITVDNDGFGDGNLTIGTITLLRTGEERSIVSNVSDVIKIGYQFIDIQVGDTVELTQGCDHLKLGHCTTRFNNVANYGGFDDVPVKNPFDSLVNQDKIVQTVDILTKKEMWQEGTTMVIK